MCLAACGRSSRRDAHFASAHCVSARLRNALAPVLACGTLPVCSCRVCHGREPADRISPGQRVSFVTRLHNVSRHAAPYGLGNRRRVPSCCKSLAARQGDPRDWNRAPQRGRRFTSGNQSRLGSSRIAIASLCFASFAIAVLRMRCLLMVSGRAILPRLLLSRGLTALLPRQRISVAAHDATA